MGTPDDEVCEEKQKGGDEHVLASGIGKPKKPKTIVQEGPCQEPDGEEQGISKTENRREGWPCQEKMRINLILSGILA